MYLRRYDRLTRRWCALSYRLGCISGAFPEKSLFYRSPNISKSVLPNLTMWSWPLDRLILILSFDASTSASLSEYCLLKLLLPLLRFNSLLLYPVKIKTPRSVRVVWYVCRSLDPPSPDTGRWNCCDYSIDGCKERSSSILLRCSHFTIIIYGENSGYDHMMIVHTSMIVRLFAR
jgi:hypothetical protein